ncbi:MAG TPA: RDD family protein [Actinomycetota bacterium]|nr:RDD family protein [Actinomycetota bacterium]
MRYEDRITIPTPEGVSVELTLAGIGSRFVASLVDTLIKLVLFVASLLALFGGAQLFGSEGATFIAQAIFSIVTFVVWFGYDVLFETLANGRTPGKRWTSLRVVRIGGRPVGFVASAIRNLLRLIDLLPGAYVVGMISIALTRLNQRVGDIAAGTVVVRELGPAPAAPRAASPGSVVAPAADDVADVSAITAEELVTVRRFLERRGDLTPAARAQLANDLWTRLRGKVAGLQDLPPEPFLEQLAATKARRN